jgi:hypothetical protein
VDRRLNALAAGLDEREDPPGIYVSDVMRGEREGHELTLIERYLGTALAVERMRTPAEFVKEFAETSRVLRHLPVAPAQAAELVFDLYQRHSRQVTRALAVAVGDEPMDLVRRRLPANCLLRLAVGATVRPSLAAPDGERNGHQEPCSAGDSSRLIVDPDTFKASYRGNACELGNSREFWLLERLSRRPGNFFHYDTLRDDVWNNPNTTKNTIHKTVSNLNRKLRESRMEAVKVDGSEKDHYRLLVLS